MDENAVTVQRFKTDLKEVISGLVSYVIGFLYISMAFSALNAGEIEISGRDYGVEATWKFLIFAALATAWVLWYYGIRSGRKEKWLWLGAMWVSAATVILKYFFPGIPFLCRIWPEFGMPVFLVHLLFAYWVLNTSGQMAEQKTGRFFVLDGMNALFVLPFKNYALRIRSLVAGIGEIFKTGNRTKLLKTVITIVAIIVALILLRVAGNLMIAADSHFASAISGVWDKLSLANLFSGDIGETIFEIILSIPVGAYLNGMVAGEKRTREGFASDGAARTERVLGRIKVVPYGVWFAVFAAFAVFYAVFICFQFGHFFGAFIYRTAPGSLTLAEYAREGFFELLRLLVLNFAVIFLVAAFSSRSLWQNKLVKTGATVILGESLLFAFTAASKLFMYIGAFGFTPLRIQGAWLITVLAAACVCMLVSLWSGRKTSRFWFLFSAVTLVLSFIY